jgi:urease accessory protein
MMLARSPPAPPARVEAALQRAKGVGRLHVALRPDAIHVLKPTVARLYQEGAAKLRFSARQADHGLTAALINTAGGLAGGDQFEWVIELDEGASCTAVTQACEKVYRAEDEAATVYVDLKLRRRSRLDWLPQETILFDGARLDRTFDIQVAEGARLLAVEAVLLGRRAMGEHTPFVHLRDRWRVWNGETLIFADEVRLDPTPLNQKMDLGAALLNGAGAYASVLYVGDDHIERGPIVRDLLDAGRDHVQGGASAFAGKLFCRMLARDGRALRRVLIPVVEALRDGEPLPRLWTI